MNPFNLRGPEFLEFFLLLFAVCGAASMVARWALRMPAGAAGPRHCALDALEVALLAGGRDRAFHAAVARLAAAGLLEVDAVERTLCPRGGARAGSALEQRILEEVGNVLRMPIREVKAKVGPSLEAAQARLRSLGLLPESNAAVVVSAGLWVILAAFGAVKIAIGTSRHRPAGILALLVVVALVLALGFATNSPVRSRLGDNALAVLQSSNDGLRSAAGACPADVGLSVALFGTAVLSGTPLEQVALALRPPPRTGASDGSSGCSSSGCGGGGGGGGCGGCGS